MLAAGSGVVDTCETLYGWGANIQASSQHRNAADRADGNSGLMRAWLRDHGVEPSRRNPLKGQYRYRRYDNISESRRSRYAEAELFAQAGRKGKQGKTDKGQGKDKGFEQRGQGKQGKTGKGFEPRGHGWRW